jgi:hypothetical protein
MTSRDLDAISRIYREDGQTFLRVTPTHAISEDWLLEHTDTLYRQWLRSADCVARDRIARRIETWFTALEDRSPHRGRGDPRTDIPAAGSAGLLVMIDDYETQCLARGGDRTHDAYARAAIEEYADEHGLSEHPHLYDLRLRDWAETRAPAQLADWQRRVTQAGDLNAGTQEMQAIRTLHPQRTQRGGRGLSIIHGSNVTHLPPPSTSTPAATPNSTVLHRPSRHTQTPRR